MRTVPAKTLVLAILLALAAPAATCAQLYVKWDAAGANDGSSWLDAYTDLQDALVAAVAGDQIWVAAGTYVPTTSGDRSAEFYLVDSVGVYGGFDGTETELSQRDHETHVTILSGEIGAPGPADNSRRVVAGNMVKHAVLDGFTVTGGYGGVFGGGIDNGGGWIHYENLIVTGNSSGAGGGMSCLGQHATLTNVSFVNNTATSGGGGLSVRLAGDPVLTGCSFTGNSTAATGGAISHTGTGLTLIDCDFDGNTASGNGGGVCLEITATITGCIFENNESIGGNGGGVCANATTTISDSQFRHNSAKNVGGGVGGYLYGGLTISGAVFEHNNAGNGGGLGIADITTVVTNSVFFANSAGDGGGVGATNAALFLTNVTLHNNTASRGGGGLRNSNCSPGLTNVILWSNFAPAGDEIANYVGSVPQISYSLIHNSGGSGGGWDTALGTDGGNNLDGDPLYADAPNGNLRPSAGSPAINAGDNAAPYIQSVDLDGNARVLDGVVDMGAYEYDPATGVANAPEYTNRLGQNYPNPFNPTTTIEYSIARPGHVTLRVYDVTGRPVRTLVDEVQTPGQMRLVRWDGRSDTGNPVASGVYLYRLEAPGLTRTNKMVMVR
jgi:hypothetical protein